MCKFVVLSPQAVLISICVTFVKTVLMAVVTVRSYLKLAALRSWVSSICLMMFEVNCCHFIIINMALHQHTLLCCDLGSWNVHICVFTRFGHPASRMASAYRHRLGPWNDCGYIFEFISIFESICFFHSLFSSDLNILCNILLHTSCLHLLNSNKQYHENSF